MTTLPFKFPFPTLVHGFNTPFQITTATVEVLGNGGDRPVVIRLIGNNGKFNGIIAGDLHNMSLLAQELVAKIPTVALHGENEWVVVTELPNKNLLLCLKHEAREVLLTEDSEGISFLLDAISYPGLKISLQEEDELTGLSGPAIHNRQYLPQREHQLQGARLWIYAGGDALMLKDRLMNVGWAILRNVEF